MYKPWQLRRVVILPIRAMQNYLVGFDPDPGIVQVRLKDPEMVKEDAERISATLKARHRGVMDFEYRTADRLDEVMGMLRNATLLIMILSTISLTVGGLSIMNVMLSSISERVREIGVRKALGASDLQIFVQFITESVALSCIGGCVGAALGTLPLFFKGAIQRSTDGSIIPTILPEHVLYVSLVIIGVGVFFGLYPAIKASRMNPIDALRYE
jgi:putative ABC transport system permease protein